MTRAILSLGSNLEDRAAHLRQAVAGLGDRVAAVSKVYETPAWPPGDAAPKYLNAAVLVEGPISAGGWLALAHALEQPTKDRQQHPGWKFPARTLDIDVIMVWDQSGQPVVSSDPVLTLPHPRAHLRAFVLKPWHDVQPDAELPGVGTIENLLKTGPIASDLAKIKPYPTQLS